MPLTVHFRQNFGEYVYVNCHLSEKPSEHFLEVFFFLSEAEVTNIGKKTEAGQQQFW